VSKGVKHQWYSLIAWVAIVAFCVIIAYPIRRDFGRVDIRPVRFANESAIIAGNLFVLSRRAPRQRCPVSSSFTGIRALQTAPGVVTIGRKPPLDDFLWGGSQCLWEC